MPAVSRSIRGRLRFSLASSERCWPNSASFAIHVPSLCAECGLRGELTRSDQDFNSDTGEECLSSFRTQPRARVCAYP